MSRGTILGTGLFALTLVALLCIPRHLPVAPAAAVPASFSANLDNGHLTLAGVVTTEQEKALALARAQELFRGGKVRITDDLRVEPDAKAEGWESALPVLLTQLYALQSPHASVTLDGRIATLTGTVSSADAKGKLLRETASALGSSVKVQDHISVATATPVSAAPNQPAPVSRAQLQTALDDVLRGDTVSFESNSATLTPRGRAVVDKVGSVLKRAPEASIEIAGHTDLYGDPDYNLQLSQRRADAVRQYLTAHGSTNRFTVAGYGSTRPLINDRTRAASQKNRRIEFRVKEER
jgi:OOP family OmpA-OmpF porin